MERPFGGRAIIRDYVTRLRITIPAKKHWFLLIFYGAWLGGWLMGEIFGLGTVIGHLSGHPGYLFILFWVIGWMAGGFFVMSVFWWNLAGREIITVGQGSVRIEKKGTLLARPRTYNLNDVKNLRVQEEVLDTGGYFGGRRLGSGPFSKNGKFRFDYGLQTVKFGDEIDEAEARSILARLKQQGLISESNCGQ